jgi:hypothetical protein
VVDNEEKAEALLNSFFPKVAETDHSASPPEEIQWEPITELEIYRSIETAKGTTAPGEDGIPTLVLKRLWTYLRTLITPHFHQVGGVSVLPQPVEKSKYHRTTQTRKVRLYGAWSIPTDFTAEYSRKDFGSSNGRTTAILGRITWVATRDAVRRTAWPKHRVSAPGACKRN